MSPVVPRFRLFTLGDLRLEDSAGRELLSGRRKELALLAFLGRRAPRPATREELAALLWSERESAKARQSLRHVVLQLRRALGDAIDVAPDRVQLDARMIELDATAVEREVADGHFRDAVARWHGDFLAGLDDLGGESFRSWLEAERELLRRRIGSAFERLVADDMARGAWSEAVVWAQRWADLFPLDEHSHRRLIEALTAAGRANEALIRHGDFVARLRAELEQDASPAFLTLAIDLAGTSQRTLLSAPAPPSAALLVPDMVGRAAVLAELIAAWREARAGRSATVLVAGDLGLGKSRLCQEFLRWVKQDDLGSFVLAGRAHEADRDVPWSTSRDFLAALAHAPGLLGAAPAALATVAQIAPEIAHVVHRPGNDSATSTQTLQTSQTSQTVAALCEIVAAVATEVPVLVLLDDTALADDATQQLLVALLERPLPGVMLVMTTQPDALTRSPLGNSLRQSLSLRRLQLQPLRAADTEELIRSMVVLDPADRSRLAARLHADGAGNPFYVSELVFSLADDGALAIGGSGHWRVDPDLLDRRLPLPSGIREAVQRRLGALSDDERLCLEVALKNGGRVDADVMARAAALTPARTRAAFDRLISRRLLREASAQPGRAISYEFAHEIVRRVAQEVLAPASSPGPPAPRARRRTVSPGWLVAALAALAVIGTLAGLAIRQRALAGGAASQPSIAIVAVTVAGAGGDTAVHWLAEGLPRMIAAKLARSMDVDLVPPSRSRALFLRAGHDDRSALSAAQVLDIARRLRATIAVSGELTKADTALVLSLTTYDVGSGRVVRSHVLARAEPFGLADEAAARLLDVAGAQGSGLRLGELETSSVAAYQLFVEATRLSLEGHSSQSLRALDAAIALDSGFISAVQERLLAAMSINNYALADRLLGTLERYSARASEYDRLLWAMHQASRNADHKRSEALGRHLVRRWPRDPRAYNALIWTYLNTGRPDAAETILRDLLVLDSLGMDAGTGPCAQCLGYSSLANVRSFRGDWRGAEAAARRATALRPEVPSAWFTLASVLAHARRYDEALAAMRQSVALSGDDPPMLDQLARMLIMARRIEEADSLVTAWRAGREPGVRRAALDLRVMLDRERGRLRASNRSIDVAIAEDSSFGFLQLVRGNNLGRLGEYSAAARVYEQSIHLSGDPGPFPPSSVHARGFCWHHALLADAVAPAGDTLRLLAIADSLERGCAGSYYGRDWTLHHHVRGLVHAAAGRYEEAASAFRRAQWVVGGGWSRTTVELAKAELALGRPREALAALAMSYATPLDAMGRYVPRSELDYYMALAFSAADMPDSAARYAGHVRRAWRNADPEVARLLAALPD